MATLMETVSEAIRETIDQGISESLPDLDPTFKSIMRTSIGVVRTGIGRDWKAKHVFSGSICGSHKWRAAAGRDAQLDGSSGGDGFTIYDTGQVWPSISEMAGPGIIQRELLLKEGFGDFPVPLHLLRSDRLDAAVGSMVGEIVRGASKKQALSRVHAFWKASTGDSIGTIVSDAGGTDITATNQDFVLVTGRIRAFYPGMFIDIYTNSSGVPGSIVDADDTLFVTKVDYLTKTVTIRALAGETTALGAATTYHIVPKDSQGLGPSGLADIISGGGTGEPATVYNITLATYPQFKSLVVSTESGALTSDKLNKYVAGFNQAYGLDLDTIIMTDGVLTGFLENLDSTSQLIRYEGQRQAQSIRAGFESFGYMYNGKVFRILVSPYCPIGTVYILKFAGQNFKKYVPPRLPSSQSDGRFAGEVEFVAPSMGSSSIFMPLLLNSAPTDKLRAPYLDWCEFAPTDVRGIKLSTFDENVHTG